MLETRRCAGDLLVIVSLIVFLLAVFSADSWAGVPGCRDAYHSSSFDQLPHQQAAERSIGTDSCCIDESMDCTSSVCGACSGTSVILDTMQITDLGRDFLPSDSGAAGYRPVYSPPSHPPPQRVI